MSEISGLSVLIPVYNCDVREFISGLHRQCTASGIPFEILCYDDYSAENFRQINRSLSGISDIRYKEMEKNYGRSAIRNILANDARYDFLIFLDCDGKLVSENFIANYLTSEYAEVKIGGRVYSQLPPSDKDYYLHWLTGSRKEVISPSLRQTNPYESLMLNNIFIKKQTYLDIRLDENIKGYGHEDSLFGFELQARNVYIQHLDNPVEHLQLDNKEAFLSKSEEAVGNFAWMLVNKNVGRKTRLYKTYRLLQKTGMLPLFCTIMKMLEKKGRQNLLSSKPSLLWLDLLKLLWLRRALRNGK